jgi:hypothetical protein
MFIFFSGCTYTNKLKKLIIFDFLKSEPKNYPAIPLGPLSPLSPMIPLAKLPPLMRGSRSGHSPGSPLSPGSPTSPIQMILNQNASLIFNKNEHSIT